LASEFEQDNSHRLSSKINVGYKLPSAMDDLTDLEDLNEASICKALEQRYAKQLIYVS
jgi:myosin heavy subunit